MIDFLTSMLKVAKIPYSENEPLAPKSTFKVGGNARLFVTPQTPEQLERVLGAVRSTDLPFFVTGGGSNVVFPDGTYAGTIISTQGIKEIFYDSDETAPDSPDSALVTCQCGVPMAAFVDFCTRKNLRGAEQFAGLPGTVGGAVYMNARCFDRSISDILYSTKHIEFELKAAKEIELPDLSKILKDLAKIGSHYLGVTDGYYSMEQGQTDQVHIDEKNLPDGYSRDDIVFSVKDGSIASVNKAGKVTANREGTTTLTVSTKDKKYQEVCVINVLVDYSTDFEGVNPVGELYGEAA